MQLRPELVRQQIERLLLTYPELEEDGQLRADVIEGETDFHELLRQIERRRQEACSLAGALATNIAELEIRRGRFERREQAMRDLAFKLMSVAEVRKVEMPEATYSVRNVPPSVVIVEEKDLPDDACKFVRKPDKTKIKELLEVGPVAGACMSNGSATLTIRTK